MPDQQIFCNTPWYELHVYWDGSLGICCQEDHKLYDPSQSWNIADVSIRDWFNSLPVRQFRSAVLADQPVSACSRCYAEEHGGGHSRRLRSNAKSVIFTRQAFRPSFMQSPGQTHFQHSQLNQGHTATLPIDIHVDLGNYCNLACKMCDARASSTIAAQEVKWGISSSRQYLGTDWTRDPAVWQRFLDQLLDLSGLNNIHFMGGETLLTRRFDDLVDWLDRHGRHDVCFSFVTNGTVYREDLLERLSRFRRVGIEVSVETMTDHNRYQRQGTDNDLVRRNLYLFRQWSDRGDITVTLRPAPSLLSVGWYHTLLDYAIRHRLVVKSNLCTSPDFLRIEVLPDDVKRLYLDRLDRWASTVTWPDLAIKDYNASDPNNSLIIAREEARMIRTLLEQPCPDDNDRHLQDLVRHCERWDRVYGLDARSLYPEFIPTLDRFGYVV